MNKRTLAGEMRERIRLRNRDRALVESGANRARMRKRAAAKAGLTVAEYEHRQEERSAALAERRADALERQYVRNELRAKHDDMAEEFAQARRSRASAYMLARYHSDPDNWSTRKKRRRIFERDNWRCRVCDKAVTDQVAAGHTARAVAGHIVAKATGGEWSDENMATLCHPCNVADGVNATPIQTHIVLFKAGAAA